MNKEKTKRHKLIIRVTTSSLVGQQWGGSHGEKIMSKDFSDLGKAEDYYNDLKEKEDWTCYTTISIIHT